jgi:hypothetical protein
MRERAAKDPLAPMNAPATAPGEKIERKYDAS